ncbi:MAG: methyl-accepting chemotaxis protein [Nitrospirae bacterium]|nr:methyl-accepting chemotaxis protein [Nitrospirota bacterium]
MIKGLKLKFSVIIAVLFLLWVALGAYINIYRYGSMTGGEVRKDGDIVARAVAAAVAQDMAASNYMEFDQVVESLTKDSDIAYIKIEDAAGMVAKEAGSANGEKGLVTVTQPVTADGMEIGKVTVSISTAEHKASMRKELFLQGLAVVLLGLISLYALVSSFNKMVLMPLDRMNSILKGMAAGGGDLTQRLDVNTTDEIGDLAKNFNTFLWTLREMVVKAHESTFRVLSISDRIGSKSKNFLATAQEQADSTNENFRVLERMDRSVQDVAGSAESLSITAVDSSATVTEMAAQVDVVADSTMDLSGHVEEASSSISEMTNSIKEVAENVRVLADLTAKTTSDVSRIEVSIRDVEAKAKESARLSLEVSDDADTLGNEAIVRTIEGMERIKETVDETSAVIENLGKRSVEIGQIVKVIDEVTNQTSLLALNAAILAAQAGEHGKGFAVVADEIKDLAERTSSSTGEIARLIKAVQKESVAAVESMRTGKERVLEGTQMAYGAGEALKKILESSNRSMETAMSIERATTKQVEAVKQVAEAVGNVNQRIQYIERATQEQSKGSELIAAAADKINDVAKEVRKAMTEQARAIKEFARSLDDTKEMVGTIADATKNQSEESSGLIGSMEKFLDIAQKNTEVSTEMEAAVSELLTQAEALRDEMGRFKV